MSGTLGASQQRARFRVALIVASNSGKAALLAVWLALGCASGVAEQSWNEARREARRQGYELDQPDWPRNAAALEAKVRSELRATDRQFEQIARLAPASSTFENCVGKLDALEARLARLYNECFLLKEVSPDEETRSRASMELQKLRQMRQHFAAHPGLLASLQQVRSENKTLSDDQQRLVALFLGDAIRAGAHLPEAARGQLESGWQKLDELCAMYDANLRSAQGFETLSRADLSGVPPFFLELPGIQTGPDEFTVEVHQPWQVSLVLEHAAREDTRRRMLVARHRLAPENVVLLRDILDLRRRQAGRLASRSWAHLQTEAAWVGDPQIARRLLAAAEHWTEPGFTGDIEELRRLKSELDRDADGEVHLWDWPFLRTRKQGGEIGFEPQAYHPFFALTRTLESLFGLADHLLGVTITQIDTPRSWAPDVLLAIAQDTENHHPLGLIYLDLFAREGKPSRFAQFDLAPARRVPNGRFQCPVVVLTASFPRPNATEAVGLTPREVQSLYHEFGHVLHALLVETDYARIWRDRGPRDYPEVPAVVFEHWARDAQTLKTWAVHVRDPNQAIPDELLQKLRLAHQTARTLTQREQIAYAWLDLDLHEHLSAAADPVAAAERTFEHHFLPLPTTRPCSFPATLDHLTGYDARYYSYVLADAVATQLLRRFRQSPLGLLDPELGRSLRTEVFGAGGRRPLPFSLDRVIHPAGSSGSHHGETGAWPGAR